MDFPLYIFYELLIRLSTYHSDLGEYLSRTQMSDHWVLRTTKGYCLIDEQLLECQFSDPDQITATQLRELAAEFRSG